MFFVLICAGCADAPQTASVDQFAEGEQLYKTYCAHCHEVENGIGPILKPDVLATRVTAQSLFNYNQRNMPYEAGNTLAASQYWAMTAYLLMRNDLMDRSVVLSSENAKAISLQPAD